MVAELPVVVEVKSFELSPSPYGMTMLVLLVVEEEHSQDKRLRKEEEYTQAGAVWSYSWMTISRPQRYDQAVS